jgi:membrane protein required for beta-lactamase induction
MNMKVNDAVGKWLGWIGLVLGVIGFFWASIWMGIGAIVLGLVGIFSSQKVLNGVAMGAGVIALIIGLV